jgi:Na+/proline symporter
MLTGMIVGIIWMCLGLTDKLEAVYPVVLVSYSVGIIVSILTDKSKKEIKKVA